MSNLFGNLSRSSSHSNTSRMEHDFKMLEENTSKFENQLILWNNTSKIGKCQNKISKIFIK